MKTLLTITLLFGLLSNIIPQEIERIYVNNDKKELILRRTQKSVLYFETHKKDTFFLGIYSDSIPKNLGVGVCVKLPKDYDTSNDNIVIYFDDDTYITIYRKDLPTVNNYATYLITFSDLYFLENKKVKKISFDKGYTFRVKSKRYFIDFFKKIK